MQDFAQMTASQALKSIGYWVHRGHTMTDPCSMPVQNYLIPLDNRGGNMDSMQRS